MLATLALLLWLALCAWHDLRHRHIANRLSLGATLVAALWLGLTQHSLLGAPWPAALVAAGLGLALSLPGWWLRRLGGGDVKVLLALGLASDPGLLLCGFAVACLFTVLTMLLAPWLLTALPLPPRAQRLLRGLAPNGGRSFPFVLALFIGVALTLTFIR
ncbi:MAG: hypothetical protein GAK43_01789 [Stenotrophomonas maltophilia]|nr:MAG: hypothetical protein GAK43_01789 [Stenotrophomonas maltophilia]